ncbi:MAG: cyanophycin synthetase [bacterium]
MKYYLVGIKGAGMASLSNILFDLGHEVRGCDFNKVFFTDKKINNEIIIDSFDSILIDNDYIYIIGNAYKTHEIRGLVNNCVDYTIFIETFFKMEKIAISGTHGKTTTTSFLSQITNKEANVLSGDGNGKGNKNASYLILEACEYKNHFLNYTNKILLINNIEYDHPDFFNNINEVIMSFQRCANNSEVLVVNGDCTNCLKIKHFNKIRFGMKNYNDIKFLYKQFKSNIVLTIYFYGNKEEIILPILAKHNIYNYVGAFILSKLIDSSDEYILEKSKTISLPSRRQEITKKGNSIIVDDYAHHPTEIKNTLEYLKEYYDDYEVVVLFQPHTYSRTDSFIDDFITSLSIANEVYILDVFSSVRETGEENNLLNKTKFEKFDEKILEEIGIKKKVYVFMGAGDVNNLINQIK